MTWEAVGHFFLVVGAFVGYFGVAGAWWLKQREIDRAHPWRPGVGLEPAQTTEDLPRVA